MDDDKRDWSHDDMNQLIQMYKSLPALWDQSALTYRDKTHKMAAYTKLADHFKTTLQEIRRKLHNIRCQFTTEIRRMKFKASKLNVHITEVDSDWKYFDSLRYLLVNYTEFQKNEGSIVEVSITSDLGENTNTSSTGIEYLLGEQQSEEEASDADCKPSTSHKHNNIIPKTEEIFFTENEYQVSKKRKISDEDHRIFGEYVASELRNLTERGAKKLKLKIRKAILDITMEEFNLESETVEYLE